MKSLRILGGVVLLSFISALACAGDKVSSSGGPENGGGMGGAMHMGGAAGGRDRDAEVCVPDSTECQGDDRKVCASDGLSFTLTPCPQRCNPTTALCECDADHVGDGLVCEHAWPQRTSGTGRFDVPSIAVDANGNVFVAGSFDKQAAFGDHQLSAAGSYDVFVAKLSPAGHWLWAVRAGGEGEDHSHDIALDANGDVFVTGAIRATASFGDTELTSLGDSDVFVAKISADGQWRWAEQAGGGDGDLGEALATDASGDVIVTGTIGGTASFGDTELTSLGDSDVFVAKISADGQWRWAERAGGGMADVSSDVALDPSGDILVVGVVQDTAYFGETELTSLGARDVFVAKLSPDGQWRWAERAGGLGIDFGRGIVVDAAGDAFVVGNFSGTARFGETELTSLSSADIFVAKISSGGQWRWAERAGGEATDIGYDLALSADGDVLVSGNFQGDASFGETVLTAAGNLDVLVARLSPERQWRWAKRAGGAFAEAARGIALNANGDIFVTGSFRPPAHFGETEFTGGDSYAVFVAKLSSSGDWW